MKLYPNSTNTGQWQLLFMRLFSGITTYCMKEALKRDANIVRALAVVRFGHRLPTRYKHANRTNNNTLRC